MRGSHSRQSKGWKNPNIRQPTKGTPTAWLLGLRIIKTGCVIQGAWYPDSVIKDMASGHVFKFTPTVVGAGEFRKLPTTHLMYAKGKASPLYQQGFLVNIHR